MAARKWVKCLSIVIFSLISRENSRCQPIANFTANQLSGCAPLIVSFTDLSTGSPSQWKWELGDGTQSVLQNPSTTYFKPGEYTIKLKVKNAKGEDSLTRLAFIKVYATPNVNFTSTSQNGCYPLQVNFADLSASGSGTISSWDWDFGDGILGSTANPSNTYLYPGSYNVTLVVKNSFGCSKSISKTEYIIAGNKVKADFSHNENANCNAPFIINFTTLSTGPGTLSYFWDFGDGTSSTAANPSHNYLKAGSYTVKLIAKSSWGCTDTVIKTNTVHVGYSATFFSEATACPNQGIAFTNTSLPSPISSFWDFGDGTTSLLNNPNKSYSLPGIYTVKLINDWGNCKDSVIKKIKIIDKVFNEFTTKDSIGCKAPHTVNFINSGINAKSYLWNFGDGTTSTNTNPSHNYNAEGIYDVTLIATNANGCSDTLKKSQFIKVQIPKVTINNKRDSGCAPLQKKFSATVNSPDPIIEYLWDFGDGTTSTEATPTHSFVEGEYTIKLTVTTKQGCTATALLEKGVLASSQPTVNFVGDPKNVCAQVPIHFKDLSSNNVTKWLWRFGDYDTSTLQNPSHVYIDTGYMNVSLTVWNNGCSNTTIFNKYIYIKPPIARFNYGYSCTNPYIKYFYQFSIGADEWLWDFGDGTTSTEKNPIHVYPSTGKYTVVLTVKSKTNNCSYATSRIISVIIEKPDFIASDSVICKHTNVTFTSVGLNPKNILYYEWDFGDDYTGTGPVASHVYKEAGEYNVRLITTNKHWCRDTIIKKFLIKVNGPKAKFTTEMPGNCLKKPTVFHDYSTSDGVHPIINWNWNYGDGVSENLNEPPFQHLYNTNGNYFIELQIKDKNGCTDTYHLSDSFIISKPLANFISTDTFLCGATNVKYTNFSTGPALQYLWQFGDGSPSGETNPVHQYIKNGNYNTKLVVTDQFGCTDSISKINSISITSPQANFTINDSMSTCLPKVLHFTNTSTNYVSQTWDFGDGTSTKAKNPSHFYTKAGVYQVALTVFGEGGCVDSIKKQISVSGPIGSINYNSFISCAPSQLNFTAKNLNTSNYVWDFGDGTLINTTDSIISHTYNTPGTYLPKLILVDKNGCQLPITGADTIQIKGVVANFHFTNSKICENGSVKFLNTSSGNDKITHYTWDFGDGSIANSQHPEHSYISSGLFYPKLIVKSQNGCTDTTVAAQPVKVTVSPKAKINSTGSGCMPLQVDFKAILVANDTSAVKWKWNFANGNTSTLQNPPTQFYTNSGVYPVQLVTVNSSGCTDTVSTKIEAYPTPKVNAGFDKFICAGKSIMLNATGADNYKWHPSSSLTADNISNPIAQPEFTTTYWVKGTFANGCSSTDSITVKVKQSFKLVVSSADSICKGASVQLTAKGGNHFSWNPATTLNANNIANPVAHPLENTVYQVISTDDMGCFTDTGYIPIIVRPTPTVSAGSNKTIANGETATLSVSYSQDVTKIVWKANPGILSTNTNDLSVQPKETTDYFVEVNNQNGCKATDKVTVFVLCNDANIYFPNTFSPNNDHANDRFYPRGKGLFSIKSFRIFNRWGQMVFEKNNFMPNDSGSGWDGTFKGSKLAPDAYVYIAEIICNTNSVLTYKGNITLIK